MERMNGDSKRGRLETKRIRNVEFLCEQDGSPERELKEQLANLFDGANWVTRAYLARVLLDGEKSPGSVALCVRGQPGPSRAFAEQVGKIFGPLFGRHECLEILRLRPEEEAELVKVCKPFWPIRRAGQ